MIAKYFPTLDRLWSRLGGWPRRAVAGALLIGGLFSLLLPDKPAAAGPTREILVSARTIEAGTTITGADVRVVGWPYSLLPSTALSRPDQAVGKVLTAELNVGEPITAARVHAPEFNADIGIGQVAVAVTVTGSSRSLLWPGAHIDLYAGAEASYPVGNETAPSPGASGAAFAAIAENVAVLSVAPPVTGAATSGAAESIPIVITCARATAAALAREASTPFTAALRPGQP